MKMRKGEPRVCLGFGISEGLCENLAAGGWAAWWCDGCARLREESLGDRAKLMVDIKAPWEDDGVPEPDYRKLDPHYDREE